AGVGLGRGHQPSERGTRAKRRQAGIPRELHWIVESELDGLAEVIEGLSPLAPAGFKSSQTEERFRSNPGVLPCFGWHLCQRSLVELLRLGIPLLGRIHVRQVPHRIARVRMLGAERPRAGFEDTPEDLLGLLELSVVAS